VKRAVVFLVVCFGWALFRSTSMNQAASFFFTMLQSTTWTIPIVIDEVLTNQRITWMMIGLVVWLIPKKFQLGLLISESNTNLGYFLRSTTVLVIAPLSCVYALTTTFSPFLYFQF
jgi:alginate O-acetyltransferase complex protein AlgI